MRTRYLAMALMVAALVAPRWAAADAPKPRMVVKTHYVADGVLSCPTFGALPSCGASDKAQCKKCENPTDEKELIQLIKDVIAPQSWAEMGGAGTIDYHPGTLALTWPPQISLGSLVINQTPDIQEQVADLLGALRRLHSDQVALEFRLLCVPEDFVEQIGVDFSQPGQPKRCTGLPCKATKCLTDKELVLFLKAAQGDARTTITQAPKMTVVNGQVGAIDVRCQESGVRWHARPVICPDGHSVQVAVDFESVDKPAATAKIEKKVIVPDGCTAIVGTFKKVEETRCECSCPVFGQIPYMGRLFRNVGYGFEPMRVYVLMTPKIVHQVQEKVKASGCGTAKVEAGCASSPCDAAAHGPCVKAHEADTGNLMFDIGVCSDAGVTGSCVMPKAVKAAGCCQGTTVTPAAPPAIAVKVIKVAGGCQACCGHAMGCCPMPAAAMPCSGAGPLPCPLCGAMPAMPAPVWNHTWVMRPSSMCCGAMPAMPPAPTCCGAMPAMPAMTAACRGCCVPMTVATPMPGQFAPCAINACCAVAAVETQSCAKPCRQAKAVAELVKAYEEACAAGHVEEAEKFAKAALTLDPMCFCHK